MNREIDLRSLKNVKIKDFASIESTISNNFKNYKKNEFTIEKTQNALYFGKLNSFINTISVFNSDDFKDCLNTSIFISQELKILEVKRMLLSKDIIDNKIIEITSIKEMPFKVGTDHCLKDVIKSLLKNSDFFSLKINLHKIIEDNFFKIINTQKLTLETDFNNFSDKEGDLNNILIELKKLVNNESILDEIIKIYTKLKDVVCRRITSHFESGFHYLINFDNKEDCIIATEIVKHIKTYSETSDKGNWHKKLKQCFVFVDFINFSIDEIEKLVPEEKYQKIFNVFLNQTSYKKGLYKSNNIESFYNSAVFKFFNKEDTILIKEFGKDSVLGVFDTNMSKFQRLKYWFQYKKVN